MMGSAIEMIVAGVVFALVLTILPAEAGMVNQFHVKTNDTLIGFAIRDKVPVIYELKTPGSKTQNWVAGTPEAALPKVVEAADGLREIRWLYKSTTVNSSRISFRYQTIDGQIEAVSTWESASLPGPIEHSVTITNNGEHTVSFIPPPTISLTANAEKYSKLEHWWVEKGSGHVTKAGTHTEAITTGYSKLLFSGPYSQDDQTRDAVPWFCVHDPVSRHGLYGGVEFTGWTQITVRMDKTESLSLSLGLDPRGGKTRTRINPGSTFSFPTCFIGTYSGEVDDGCNRLHRWVENHLRPPVPGGVIPLLVNNSWGSGMAVDEAMAKRMIDDCAELGIEIYHVDAGWFREVGDWHSNPIKFPNGLDKTADYAHAKGLKFGLWVGWTQGGALKNSPPDTLSPFSHSQKSWFGNDFGDDWRNAIFSGATVCLGCADARAWCLKELRRMVKQYKLDLLEHDQNMVLDWCERNGHGHIPRDPVDTSREAAEGYYQVYDQLRRENPNLLFEDCVNGGRLADFGVAKRAHYICWSDDYDPLNLRKGFYDASYPFPPSMIELYLANHPGTTTANFKYMLRSAMLGWCTIMTDTDKWSPEQHELAKREFALYKARLRPFIASGDLYHVLPRPDGKNWDGVQYVDPKSRDSVLMVFRPQSETETQTVALRGLDPKKRYKIEAMDGSASGEMTGAELMTAGLKVHLGEKDSSDVIFVSCEL